MSFGRLLDHLLPASCHLCGMACRHSPCEPCQQQTMPSRVSRCPQCGLRSGSHGQVCGACLAHAPAYARTVVACDYVAPLDQLVMRLKYGAELDIAPLLARAISREWNDGDLPDLLCPVPLSAQRLVERGYNQALEIARVLARLRAIPLKARLLLRWRDTGPQAQLAAAQRQRNVRGAFCVSAQAQPMLKGLHVGVVDDVMTTGATLNELAALLKRHGVARVTNLVFARTPP